MADTTENIDAVIAYLESPEYLRMIASQQGESPTSLLQGSRTESWNHDSAPESTTRLTSTQARITSDNPWSAPLLENDRVELISDEQPGDGMSEGLPHFRVRDARGGEWWVPRSALELYGDMTDGLAQWERELLEGPPVPVFEDLDTPVTTSLVNQFGIRWNADSQTCDCSGCASRRRVASTPTLTAAQRPVQLRSRADGWERFADVIDRRLPFDTYGSLRGRLRPESAESGQLRDKLPWAHTLWQTDQSVIDYVIYSYRTPIAWHVTSPDNSEWVFPEVRYSTTTNHHQAKIRRALLNSAGNDTVRSLGNSED